MGRAHSQVRGRRSQVAGAVCAAPVLTRVWPAVYLWGRVCSSRSPHQGQKKLPLSPLTGITGLRHPRGDPQVTYLDIVYHGVSPGGCQEAPCPPRHLEVKGRKRWPLRGAPAAGCTGAGGARLGPGRGGGRSPREAGMPASSSRAINHPNWVAEPS